LRSQKNWTSSKGQLDTYLKPFVRDTATGDRPATRNTQAPGLDGGADLNEVIGKTNETCCHIKAAGTPADAPEATPGLAAPRPKSAWARLAQPVQHWHSGPRLEAYPDLVSRWQKLNEDTPPCFLAGGELPSAAALGRWLRYLWRLTMWLQILVLATATAIFAAEVRWLMRC
jgi:hypothetical protein